MWRFFSSYIWHFRHILIHHVTLTLTFDPLTLNFCGRSGVMWSNSVYNLSKIEQSAAELLTMWNFWEGRVSTKWSQRCRVRGTNFTKPGEDIRPSSLLNGFVSDLRYLAAFSNAGRSKMTDVEHEAKFRTFWPPVKVGEGWARSLSQWF